MPSPQKSPRVTCPECGATFRAESGLAQILFCPNCHQVSDPAEKPPQKDLQKPPQTGHTQDNRAQAHQTQPSGEQTGPLADPPASQAPSPQPPAAAMVSGPDTHTAATTPQKVLKRVYGYESFREHQLEIIRAMLDNRDAFVLMPTGSGKSLCYQIPAILKTGVGLIISPLIALMQNQVDTLRQNGVRADYLNSSLSLPEIQAVERRAENGQTDILYVAPERLCSERFLNWLPRIGVTLFAIDEAHCVSQWGHDFRPEYLQIADVTRRFPNVPKVALTATADPLTRREIMAKLDLEQAEAFISSFDRPNIRYRVLLKQNGLKQLVRFITTEHPRDSGIVYVRTRKRTDDVARHLTDIGLKALPYHAGLESAVRSAHQRRFLEEEGLIVVATIAFGMGIDKPNVRFVAHLDLPASMEAYYQETGRAGRDGQAADAWMLYALADVVAMQKLFDRSEGSEEFKRIQRRKLEAFFGFCEATECRRQALLAYFGEKYPRACGNCDNCDQPTDTWDGTVAAQKALSCVYRTGQRFGAAYLTQVLIGKSDERMIRFGHDRIKTFGVGQELSVNQWRSVYRQLLAAGYLAVNMAEISGFSLTAKSWPVLRGEQQIRLREDPRPLKMAKSKPKKSSKSPADEIDISDAPSQNLWEILRALRLSIARELEVPPYIIFHDKTLKQMVAHKPTTPDAFLAISGVGEKKADDYGERFMDAIRDFELQDKD